MEYGFFDDKGIYLSSAKIKEMVANGNNVEFEDGQIISLADFDA